MISNPSPSVVPFGLSRHRPAGAWAVVSDPEPIVATGFFIDQVRAFTTAVRRAERQGLSYGLCLARTPSFDDDSDSVAVTGTVEIAGLFGRTSRDWTVGALPRDLARLVLDRYLKRDIPVAAELVSILDDPDAATLITLVILAPVEHATQPGSKSPPGLTLVR